MRILGIDHYDDKTIVAVPGGMAQQLANEMNGCKIMGRRAAASVCDKPKAARKNR